MSKLSIFMSLLQLFHVHIAFYSVHFYCVTDVYNLHQTSVLLQLFK